MRRRRTTAAELAGAPIPVRVVILTLDQHVEGAIARVRAALASELPGLDLRLHAATSFRDAAAAEACRADIAEADIVFANMLFVDEHVRAVLPALEARRDACDAMVCAMSSGEVMRLTRMGDFEMKGSKKGLGLLKKLRGKKKSKGSDGGAAQLAMLRRLPKLLALIPGTAQDLRAYFLTLSYWLSGSTENLANLVRLLVNRYADGPRQALRGTLEPGAPVIYPDVGLYHPAFAPRITEDPSDLPAPAAPIATVGLLVMRSYVLAGDTGHYDRVIEAFEARGLRVLPAFASGLDNRPAIERFFAPEGETRIDALVSLTGFSLVGGPAFNDARAAEELLARLDVPYVAAQPLEFQSVEQWKAGSQGLTPIEATIMVAIPELDGATGPMVYGGREEASVGGEESLAASASASGADAAAPVATMVGIEERIARLGDRVARLVRLRTTPAAERRVAVVLFNFPPNAGATGTAAYLSVFQSLHRTLRALHDDGYTVEVPESVEALEAALLQGNAARYGTDANVLTVLDTEEHVRRTPFLAEIEATWGGAPGTQLSDGRGIFVLGAQFGNVMVGVQPGFGFEGDPMRLLHAKGLAPTHAFAAFYRYLRDGFEADAVLHFGTHGALEFLPGKQVGLSGQCWPDRFIGDLPNVYLYASNNPSEGALAKRRAAATLVSYLTPPVTKAGLYQGLQELRGSLRRLRALPPGDEERARLLPAVQAEAAALELAPAEPAWTEEDGHALAKLGADLQELEETLIPCGLHVLGEGMPEPARRDYLAAIAGAEPGDVLPDATLDALAAGATPKAALRAGGVPRKDAALARVTQLAATNALLSESQEIDALLRALRGGFIRPAPGGDLLRNPEVLPTGRNVHGFDPFAIPSRYALADGARQAERLLMTHREATGSLPRSVALVLWGADNLKSGGGPIGQALALLGARPRFDAYGRLCGAEVIPLDELNRPRIDVLITLSGIFRDLLPLQTRLLAEAALLAAQADEPREMNFLRDHALAYQEKTGCDLATAALRVFSNAEGAYGANVNALVDGGTWQDEDELGDAYAARKSFAYGADGQPVQQKALLESVLAGVDLAYQNLESLELGVTTIDHYFDTLGGIGQAARKARRTTSGVDAALPVYIGDQTRSDGEVRTLGEQVALESRTRSLNPKWAESMLEHGSEGVRQIEAQVTNTLGWSATTGQVDPWVYRELTKTYVLDEAMRRRLAELNPKASLKLAGRLLEASERSYWAPDAEMLAALEAAGDELEDQLEGLGAEETATPTRDRGAA
ncbi:MAG: magnesium chelatase subunit H [Myxococcota bacterium]